MADGAQHHPTAAEMRRALQAADEMFRRLENAVECYLPPDSDVPDRAIVNNLILELETAPEIRDVRHALGLPAENHQFIADLDYTP